MTITLFILGILNRSKYVHKDVESSVKEFLKGKHNWYCNKNINYMNPSYSPSSIPTYLKMTKKFPLLRKNPLDYLHEMSHSNTRFPSDAN